MQQPTNTDLMLMKCLETQERQTLRRKATRSSPNREEASKGMACKEMEKRRSWPVLGHTTPQLCPAEHPDFTQSEITTWHIQGGGNEHFQNSFTVAGKVLSTLCKLISFSILKTIFYEECTAITLLLETKTLRHKNLFTRQKPL